MNPCADKVEVILEMHEICGGIQEKSPPALRGSARPTGRLHTLRFRGLFTWLLAAANLALRGPSGGACDVGRGSVCCFFLWP